MYSLVILDSWASKLPEFHPNFLRLLFTYDLFLSFLPTDLNSPIVSVSVLRSIITSSWNVSSNLSLLFSYILILC